MAKARLIADVKFVEPDGSIIQYRVWKLPAANDERPLAINIRSISAKME